MIYFVDFQNAFCLPVSLLRETHLSQKSRVTFSHWVLDLLVFWIRCPGESLETVQHFMMKTPVCKLQKTIFLKEKPLWDWHWMFPQMPHMSLQVKEVGVQALIHVEYVWSLAVVTKGKLKLPWEIRISPCQEGNQYFFSFLVTSYFAFSSSLSILSTTF